jgi:tetratricopeptide (TPR) repeat protein
MERAFAVISADEPDEDLALLAARLSLGYWYGGDLERAAERAELALEIAEAHAFPAALALALRAKAAVAHSRGHIQEAGALVSQALRIALDHDIVEEAGTCYFWLSDRCFQRDEYAGALGYLDESLALARRLGNRPEEWSVLAERTYPLSMLGRWDEAQAASEEFTPEQFDSGGLMLSLLQSAVEIHIQRGELDDARRVFSMFSRLEESSDVQERSCYLGSRAALRRAEGRLLDALADGEATIEAGRTLGIPAQAVKQGLVEAVEAALALGESAKVEELLALIESVPPGTRPPYLDAQAKRFRARLDDDPSGYEVAAESFRHLSLPFWLAVTLLEHAELTGNDESLAEPREIFAELKATPWLERLDAVSATRTEVPA